MKRPLMVFFLVAIVFSTWAFCAASAFGQQDQAPRQGSPQPAPPGEPIKSDENKAIKEIDEIHAEVKAIREELKKQDEQKKENQDFAVVLGIGSLVVDSDVTDYRNQSNVLQSANVGRATPQLLTGVSFRSRLRPIKKWCEEDCEVWQEHPWSFFVSLKFAPTATNVLNGYVFGISYSIAKHLNALIGVALTPINEPAPGFRAAASQFVASQQKLNPPQYLSFSAEDMRNNKINALDGFALTDTSGKLIYQGNALTSHYSGGAVFGISIPIYFKSIFGK